MNGVMMLVNYFPPLPTGGAERQAERLAEYMASQNVHSGVITRKVGSLPKRDCRNGIDIYRISQFGPGKVKTLSFTILSIIKLLRLRDSYDIFHAHLAFSPAIAGVIAGKLLRKRVIVKFGNSDTFGDIQRSKKTWRGRLRLFILRHWADMCIALDPAMHNEILAAGFADERVLLMDNGIDSKKFTQCFDKNSAKQALGFNGKTVLLYTGRFTPQKALPNLLQALRDVVIERPDICLILLGHGEEVQMLTNLVSKLELQQHVMFIEPVSDVKPYLDAADIFVLPSLAEGISNSLLEAMSCGLACIATNVGGSPEVLEKGECGLLVPTGQIAELRNAIIYLATNADVRKSLGVKARQRILARYDFQVVGRQYHSLYKRLLEAS